METNRDRFNKDTWTGIVLFIEASPPYGVDGSTLTASGQFLPDWNVAMTNACRRWGGVVADAIEIFGDGNKLNCESSSPGSIRC